MMLRKTLLLMAAITLAGCPAIAQQTTSPTTTSTTEAEVTQPAAVAAATPTATTANPAAATTATPVTADVATASPAVAATPATTDPAAAESPAAATPAKDAAPAVAAPAAAAAKSDVTAPLKIQPLKEKEKKSKKAEYTGPTTIIVLPATPMLDEQGIQRLDPDGKPMWNQPVKQQRDKHGHPLFDTNGKPVFQTATELGYDEHGKKLHVKKVKPPKMIPMAVTHGTMTVDGMTGKAALDYDIADLKYIYLYAPGIGVAVVSNEPFPGATEQKDAFNNNTLTVTVDDHTLQLASEKRLLGKKPLPAYVLVNRTFRLPSIFPVMGYGTLRKPPYMWPGAKAEVRAAGDEAPPPPKDLLPRLALAPCPSGQMRKAGPAVLPGQTAPPQPCVPIKSAAAPKTTAPKTNAQAAPAKTVASVGEAPKD